MPLCISVQAVGVLAHACDEAVGMRSGWEVLISGCKEGYWQRDSATNFVVKGSTQGRLSGSKNIGKIFDVLNLFPATNS